MKNIQPLNWKNLYRLAAKEPASYAIVEIRFRISMFIMPKGIRDLVIAMLNTVIPELQNKKKNLSIKLDVEGTDE